MRPDIVESFKKSEFGAHLINQIKTRVTDVREQLEDARPSEALYLKKVLSRNVAWLEKLGEAV